MKLNKYTYQPLFLRQACISADFPDGRRVSVDLNIDGTALIGIIRSADGMSATTYTLSMRDIINEMLDCEAGEAEFNVIKKEQQPTKDKGQKNDKTSD